MKFSELIKKLIAIKKLTGDADVGEIIISGIGDGLTVNHNASGGVIRIHSNLDRVIELITSKRKVIEKTPVPPVKSVNLTGSLISHYSIDEEI